MQRSNSLMPIPGVRTDVVASHSPANQAYHLLHFAFVVAPIVAGLDKLTHVLVNWDLYLAPQIAQMLPIAPYKMMRIAGVLEVLVGLVVAIRPKIGGIIVGTWLLGIWVNLLLTQKYFDIALRDFFLALGAFALSRLAAAHERGGLHVHYQGVARP
jgi:hypothetical protein